MKDEIYQEIDDEIEKIDVESATFDTTKILVIIKKIYSLLKIDHQLSDWEKIHLAQSVFAYHSKMYFLSRFDLWLATEYPENINKEVWHVTKMHKAAQNIDIDSIMKELPDTSDSK